VDSAEATLHAAQSQALLPHRRRNPLTGEWVLVSPRRAVRPWLGQVEPIRACPPLAYDPSCYLCPGNARAGDARNPDYAGPFAFDNDFPALMPEADAPTPANHELLASTGQAGACRVLCFSPRHDLTLAQMPVGEIRGVVDMWAAQTEEFGQKYRWVQIFENKGEMMGSSNPHPHGQVWATTNLPTHAGAEDMHQRTYLDTHDRCLLLDYAELEVSQAERIVARDEHWLVVVPFWAEWPFETLLLPRGTVHRLPDLDGQQRDSLARTLSLLLTSYDRLFQTSFPYSMGWHGAPYPHGQEETASGADHWQLHWQLHCHFYPPLLRSSTVRKFHVGYELLAEAQRDLTPEMAASLLRGLVDVP
jgi:UDPglucose--hexose-1-phosphate uridylyltransferase